MLLGVDDTDSLEGGCTTHVAVQLAVRLKEDLGIVLLGNPHLVRLNPTNPWKTRGNAALALHLGLPAGEGFKVGEWNDYRIRCVGPRIQQWLNGFQTVDYTEEDKSIPATGLIGVQIHSGAPSEVWYKDIEIEELP